MIPGIVNPMMTSLISVPSGLEVYKMEINAASAATNPRTGTIDIGDAHPHRIIVCLYDATGVAGPINAVRFVPLHRTAGTTNVYTQGTPITAARTGPNCAIARVTTGQRLRVELLTSGTYSFSCAVFTVIGGVWSLTPTVANIQSPYNAQNATSAALSLAVPNASIVFSKVSVRANEALITHNGADTRIDSGALSDGYRRFAGYSNDLGAGTHTVSASWTSNVYHSIFMASLTGGEEPPEDE